MLANTINWLQSLAGWKRRGVLVILGTITSFCHAPFDLFPLLWLTFPALIWLFDSAKRNESFNIKISSAFAVGWYFGFGFYAGSTWWLAGPFLIQPEKHGWMAPLIVILTPTLFAIYWGVATAFASKFWYPDWRRILIIAIAISFAEFLKAHLFTGFPWTAIGYAFLDAWVLGQFAAVVSLYGLNFLTILIFSAPAALFRSEFSLNRGGGYLNTFVILCLIIMASFGLYRLSPSQAVPDTEYLVRVVQPNISQREKINPRNREQLYQTFRELSLGNQPTNSTAVSKPIIVVYPESALPLTVYSRNKIVEELAGMVPENHYLITGAIRTESAEPRSNEQRYYDSKSNWLYPNRPIRREKRNYYNSVVAVDSNGKLIDYYDKVHLVPIGEYIPFSSFLKRFNIEAVVQHYTGLSAGEVRKGLKIPGVPNAAPLVCYEIIFPGRVIPETGKADWIVNVTNDAWLGDTPGSFQHFDQTRMRAIEEGVPAIRAANTGISAIIDANGIVRHQIDINERGVIEDFLPAIKSTEMFEISRKYGFLTMLLISGLLVFGTSTLRPKTSSKSYNVINANE